ncbi:pyridoxal phosphate-dependent aminotransferase [Liquorilactobacillus mali]|uniref:pyridoxal phosphate-dependent aminotransferase n=1 Tax=Liquorilactobacillus mali TaxID=1618 RepID=UPI002953B4A7|nr:pyridoxal phosphate-dependent aminotransferase [Liquorilactobacillus mali]MDV7758721.1 aminotransferase class I/II-fold pyridoxal phosphate-dependent enzyme [Liquorilactobacillus mali]
MKTSNRVLNLKDSPTLELNDAINRKILNGEDIINLTVGEPNYYEPKESSTAAIKAIQKHFTHYTASAGIEPLRKAISEKLIKENNLKFSPEQIVVSNGGKQALYNTFSTLINQGDEVLIPTPAWPTYFEQVKLCGGTPTPIKLNEDSAFKLTPEILQNSISSKTKILVLNSPSNPTGATYSKEDLLTIEPIIEENHLIVISDEIYERLVFSEDKFISPLSISPYMQSHSILVNGYSKAFGMTGWRIGYSAAPIAISKKINAFQSQTTANISSISQIAAQYALNHFDTNHVNNLKNNRDKLVNTIRTKTELDLRQTPTGAFYLFPNVSKLLGRTLFGKKISNAGDFCQLLLDKVGVATTPGDIFLAPENIRISYAKDAKTMDKVNERLINFFERSVLNGN